jgi:hypothetical protein
MPYYSYNNNSGKLLEISEELIFGGSPPTGIAVSFTNITQEELDLNYVWDEEVRDFVQK